MHPSVREFGHKAKFLSRFHFGTPGHRHHRPTFTMPFIHHHRTAEHRSHVRLEENSLWTNRPYTNKPLSRHIYANNRTNIMNSSNNIYKNAPQSYSNDQIDNNYNDCYDNYNRSRYEDFGHRRSNVLGEIMMGATTLAMLPLAFESFEKIPVLGKISKRLGEIFGLRESKEKQQVQTTNNQSDIINLSTQYRKAIDKYHASGDKDEQLLASAKSIYRDSILSLADQFIQEDGGKNGVLDHDTFIQNELEAAKEEYERFNKTHPDQDIKPFDPEPARQFAETVFNALKGPDGNIHKEQMASVLALADMKTPGNDGNAKGQISRKSLDFIMDKLGNGDQTTIDELKKASNFLFNS